MSDGSTVHVRPYGYVDDEPVVRRLGDRDLFLGNAAAASTDCDRAFAHVLSLTRDPRSDTTAHWPLADDATTDYAAFAGAVDAARRLSERDGSTLIHCEAGVSRSSAVAAAAIAADEDRPFVDALHAVQDARPPAVPRPALHALGVQYVAAHR